MLQLPTETLSLHNMILSTELVMSLVDNVLEKTSEQMETMTGE